MVQRIERFVVGPLQIVQHQHQRLARGVQCHATHPGVQAEGTPLGAVGQDAGHERAGAVVEADQLPQKRGLFVGRISKQRLQRRSKGLLRLCLGLAVAHAHGPEQQVAQQAIRLVAPLGLGGGAPQAAGQHCGRQRGLQLRQQAALAQAGITQHGDAAQRAARRQHRRHGCIELGELGVATHQRRGDTIGAVAQATQAPLAQGLHNEGAHRLVQPLHRQRRLLVNIHQALHLPIRVHADAQAARRCGLLQAGGDVHGQATEAAALLDAAAPHHRPGVDAHPRVKPRQAMRLLHCGAQLPRLAQQRQSAGHRTLGVIVFDLVGTKRRLQPIARVAQHFAVVLLHQRAEGRQRTIHHRLRVFRIKALDQLRGADDVEEQDGDLPQLAQRHFQRGLGGRYLGCDRLQGSQPMLQRHQRRIDHGITQCGALALQCCNGLLKRFDFAGVHHWAPGPAAHRPHRLAGPIRWAVHAPQDPSPQCQSTPGPEYCRIPQVSQRARHGGGAGVTSLVQDRMTIVTRQYSPPAAHCSR